MWCDEQKPRHLLALCPLSNYLTSLSCTFLIYKVRIIMTVPFSVGCMNSAQHRAWHVGMLRNAGFFSARPFFFPPGSPSQVWSCP